MVAQRTRPRKGSPEAVAAWKKRLRDFFASTLRKYGITEAEYRAMLAAQGGKCLVCRVATGPTAKNPNAKFLGVEHDHLTGEVRGLVCTGSLSANTCNRLIALYNREQLLRAVAMLSDPPPARRVLEAMRNPAVREVPSLVREGTIPKERFEAKGGALDESE